MYREVARRAAAICCLAAPFSCAPASLAQGSGDTPGAAMRVQILSSSQMQQPDARLLETRQGDVRKAAELYGYDVSTGTWLQNQVICPDVPGYLLIHYLKIAQDGRVSLFTAVVPRADGRVRIVPVLYHGAQALRVLGSSPEQRAWINEVVPTKKIAAGPKLDDDWSSLAYCYAALGGAEPTSTSVTSPEETRPTLVLSTEGKALEMSFSVVGADHLFQNWTVFFDKRGEVKSIAMTASAVRPPRTAPVVELKTHVIPPQGDLKTHTIPPQEELKTHPIPNSQ
jgi:hypothetical protein